MIFAQDSFAMTSFPNNYSKAFLEMGRVIHALIMREMLTRFGERRLGYLWALFEPLTHLAFFTLIRMAMDWQAPYDTTTYTFLITGILPFFLFRNCVQKISTAISANKALMVIQQVKPLDIFLARGLLEIATYAVTTVLILSLIHFLCRRGGSDFGSGTLSLVLSVVWIIGHRDWFDRWTSCVPLSRCWNYC